MRLAAALLLAASIVAAQSDDAAAKEKRDVETAIFKKHVAEIDARIAALAKRNDSALGAAELEKLRKAREELAMRIRKLEKADRVEKPAEAPDISDLLARARKGDVAARNALLALKARIDQVLVQKPANPFQGGGRVVWMANGQQIVVQQGGVVRLGGLAPAPAKPATVVKGTPEKDAAKEEKIPDAEKKRRLAADIEDQEKRAAELEKRIVELTRRAMELERRIEELRGQAAAAEGR